MTIRICVLSGGRGAQFLIEALSGVDCELTFLINPYDSGLSTGLLRREYPGLLGISDFRKVSSTCIRWQLPRMSQLADLLEDRDITALLADEISRGRSPMKSLADLAPEMPAKIACLWADWLEAFLSTPRVAARSMPLTNLAFGNALVAGAFAGGRNWLTAIGSFTNLMLSSTRTRVLDVSDGTDAWLAARAGADYAFDEGVIVGQRPPRPIEEIFFVSRTGAIDAPEAHRWSSSPQSALWAHANRVDVPFASKDALEAVRDADLIVYSAGTQHSSLLPSYILKGLRDAIAENERAPKLLFVNGERDSDFHDTEYASNLVSKALSALTGEGKYSRGQVVTEIVNSQAAWAGAASDSMIRTKSISPGHGYRSVADSLHSTIGRSLAPSTRVVSVIVPILNEEAYVDAFAAECSAVRTFDDKHVEYIVVDGGSTDGTVEALRRYGVLEIREVAAPTRCVAVAEGIRQARGEVVCVFHADGEYELLDVLRMTRLVSDHPTLLAIGSRAHGAGSETQLRQVYVGKGRQYWLSRVGGVAVAAVLSLRLGRVISDPFCGVLAGRRSELLQLVPSAGDIDANIEMLLNAKHAQVPVSEVAVAYRPRPASRGKKTTARHGLRALRKALMHAH